MITNKNKKTRNPDWPPRSDNPFETLIIAGSASGLHFTLLHFVNDQLSIHEIYLYAKDLCESILNR